MGSLCAICKDPSRDEGFEHVHNFDRDYEFGELLGMGSFGSVYKTVKDGRVMAVKVIRTAYSSTDIDVQREGTLLQLVKGHPNIVEIYDITEYHNALLIYMEYCDEGNLIDYMKKRKPLMDETLQYLSQLVEAVKFIHSKNVIHRDIKPGNTLMKSGIGSVVLKLGDFGIGNVAATLGYFETRIGTPEYIAPEILKGKQYTFTADVYSVGVFMRKIMECYRVSDKQKSVLKLSKKMTEKNPRKRKSLAEASEKLNKRRLEAELTPLA